MKLTYILIGSTLISRSYMLFLLCIFKNYCKLIELKKKHNFPTFLKKNLPMHFLELFYRLFNFRFKKIPEHLGS